jgi:hypothetical protein
MGDPANVQAETRVNAEQASKSVMWEPTRLFVGEGRSLLAGRATEPGDPTGVLASACTEEEGGARAPREPCRSVPLRHATRPESSASLPAHCRGRGRWALHRGRRSCGRLLLPAALVSLGELGPRWR